jgi:carboxyl-terminal processing protease
MNGILGIEDNPQPRTGFLFEVTSAGHDRVPVEQPDGPSRRQPERRRLHGWGVSLGLGLVWLAAAGCATPHKTEPDFALMSEAWKIIQREYVSPGAVQPAELTYGALSGMVEALGDTGHSTFLTPAMVQELKRTERGEFRGVGIEIQEKGGRVVVVAPMDGSPAQRAGVKAGDIILKVGEDDVSDWPLNRVVDSIGGRPGTPVLLSLQDPRTEAVREVSLVRASIRVHSISWRRLPGTSLAHLRIANFDNGVTRDLRRALNNIQKEGLQGIVLDLRNNPGGLLDEAVTVASQFLKEGNVLVARDAKGSLEPVAVEKGGIAPAIPLIVLVNEGSASAAEIVAGALDDAHRAELVGQTTFGTGTVLQQFRLRDGSALLLAVEEWLTPEGRSFWHKGLTPQVAVTLPPDATPLLPSTEQALTPEQLQASNDQQLLTAVKLLNTRLTSTVPAGRQETPSGASPKAIQ